MFGFNRPTTPAAETPPVATVPEGVRAYAVGDIHGRADLLEDILTLIEADAANSTTQNHLIFLGDYVDRGRSSKEVIDRLLQPFPGFTPIFLKGNHEAALLHFLENPKFWGSLAPYGAVEMLMSYGVRFDTTLKGEELGADLHKQFSALLPPEHLAFLNALRLSYTLGDYHFVHAGVDPANPFEAQKDMDLMRIREPFLSHGKRLEKMVVHGHTIAESVTFLPHRIGIDTGAYATGKLTALVLEGATHRLIQTS